jgi:hypothetical protein
MSSYAVFVALFCFKCCCCCALISPLQSGPDGRPSHWHPACAHALRLNWPCSCYQHSCICSLLLLLLLLLLSHTPFASLSIRPCSQDQMGGLRTGIRPVHIYPATVGHEPVVSTHFCVPAAAALSFRPCSQDQMAGLRTGIQLVHIYPASHMVSDYSGMMVQRASTD